MQNCRDDENEDSSYGGNLTPGMKQYMSVKQKHPDCLVLFRMGDFYETFYQDAKTAAKELDITLTSRGKGEKRAPLAGIPYHALKPYLGKLISKGYKVCIVEQMEDPKTAKGLLKRDIVRIVTPGTVIDETILNDKANNYIMAINKEKNQVAMAFSDISTGEFSVLLAEQSRLESELAKYMPSELLLPMSLENSGFAKSLKGFFVNYLDDLHFFHDKAHSLVKSQFKGCQCVNSNQLNPLLVSSAGALLHYLSITQRCELKHISSLTVYNADDFMSLDKVTVSNLNIMPGRKDKKDDRATLLFVLDRTVTSMGSRLLKTWLLRPLLGKIEIEDRLDSVEELKENIMLKEDIRFALSNMQDIERLAARVSFRTASPRDLVAMRNTLREMPALNSCLANVKSRLLSIRIEEFASLVSLLSKAIKDEPGATVREGNVIREGYSPALDEMRKIKSDSKQWLLDFEAEEKKKTGMKFLKVGYNNVFGYFIEVSRSNLGMVPSHYVRKQTQANGERFITPELKEKENTILTADEKICELEYNLFTEVLDSCAAYIEKIQHTSNAIARLDVLQAFATVSMENSYSRPGIDASGNIRIISGRHPIVERIESGFVSNSLELDSSTRMMIITGPNMAGKSVYLKQNALIILMAQIGCFVPAKEAAIGIVDRIFSRVGASDDIASGHSTFMVEMNETANILAFATQKSFIILDEIGRGTSTYDGVSLAWAIAEHITTRIGARTLFATHYHHLNKMALTYSTIKNYNIAVSEREDEIVFLRKIVEGATDRSYGIQVAKLAGLPHEVIESAQRIITQLEMEDEIGDMLHKSIKKSNGLPEPVSGAEPKEEARPSKPSSSQRTLLDM